jgi:hypothetical protein
MSPIEAFVAAQQAFNLHVNSVSFGRDHPIQKEYDAFIQAEFKKRFPRRKFEHYKAAKLMPDYNAVAKPFHERAKAATNEYWGKRKALEAEMDKAAEACEITADMKIADKALWVKYDSVGEDAYRSQGWGAIKYARQSAEGYVDALRANGVDGEVRERVDRWTSHLGTGERLSLTYFDVYAGCNQLACDIIRHKPSITLREWVRLCWKRGVNPRVYNPFLPHEFEAIAGLDYFGNDLGEKEKRHEACNAG